MMAWIERVKVSEHLYVIAPTSYKHLDNGVPNILHQAR